MKIEKGLLRFWSDENKIGEIDFVINKNKRDYIWFNISGNVLRLDTCFVLRESKYISYYKNGEKL